MTDNTWQPPVPSGMEGVLVDGFPRWLREPTITWFREKLLSAYEEQFFPAALIRFQLTMRADYGFSPREIYFEDDVRPFLRRCDDATLVNFMDYLLVFGEDDRPEGPNNSYLEHILSEGGSKWAVAVVGDEPRLVERVPAGVLNSVQQAAAGADAAAQKLQEAWVDAFGTNPRASIAYYNAVVAVESAAFAVIPLGMPEPTLANIFSLLEAETPKWKLTLRDSEKAPGAKSLAAMLRTLWRGHDSRHGAKEYANVTIEQARAAVILAATLVWWFRSGVVIAA
ncbi:hypothetical protein ACL00U_14775 [Curtobacterium poinsettiae]|uniref:hypothetical protein n=1 Tax=Curtobacterium poinsettiae TaxID=159612 RepID=UPI00399F8F6A